MAKRRKRKLKTGVKVFFIFVLVLLIGGGYYLFYGSGVELDKYYDEIAANFKNNSNEYKKCLASSDFTEDYFSEKLGNIRDEMIGMFGSDANFEYEDLDNGYSFGKGENYSSYAASVSKLPAVFYAYHLADAGELDLNKELTYTANYKAGGSGVIQKDPIGSKYKISDLLYKAIRYSDNIAYFMILDEIGGTATVRNYWRDLGYTITYTDRFGNLSPSLGNGYIKEVYKYYLDGSENAKKLVEDMEISDNLDFVKVDDTPVAHKYGEYTEGGGYYNDVSLVFTSHPFALSITSTKGLSNSTKEFFLKVHELALDFNNLYYEEKVNYCLGKD